MQLRNNVGERKSEEKYAVIGTATYKDELAKWSKAEQMAVAKLPVQLARTPLAGKPLGYRFLREKRVGGKRVYYLVYEELMLVLLVAVSDKKNQHTTIEHIKKSLESYQSVAEEIAKQVVRSGPASSPQD